MLKEQLKDTALFAKDVFGMMVFSAAMIWVMFLGALLLVALTFGPIFLINHFCA